MPGSLTETLSDLAANYQDAYDKFVVIQTFMRNYIAGTVDDPDSFDVDGKPSTDVTHGPLGYYAFDFGSDIFYLPCKDREQALVGYTATSVPSYAMRKALIDAGKLQAVLQNLSPDPTDIFTMRWNASAPITPADTVAAAIKTATGYSDAQMTALFTAARAAI